MLNILITRAHTVQEVVVALELTLRERIVAHAQRAPRATAIAAPDRAPLSYGGLAEHVEYVVRSLGALGVRRGMRVATALPNGPELAVANVAISAAATCVPMNPALRAAELASYLQATRTDALIVQQGQFAAARDVARELSIRCIDVSVDQCDPAGIFRFADAEPTGDPAYARPSEIALLMQTSGTTGDSPTPRLVPLTHENVFRSALHTRAALELQPVDRCLNVMPVFLIHGIVGATFSSLSAGASVVCVDQFDHLRFVDWLETFNPTWYTAVPAMHQAILEQLEQGGVRRVWPALRFVRSSSSPLSVDCLKRLENALGVPVIESYGMTEAASQIASNPLPPRTRKPGSVGVPCGPEVRILDPQGRPLARAQRGEIVVRGPNVMRGYEGDYAATAEAFIDGWLRTGDEGFLDDDGYLFITGRLKEMINRGGEKILPAEVDDILRQHPAVHDAAAFGRPHPRLGEVVAAAVVLKAGMAVQPHELRSFAAERLVAPKVPHDVHFVSTLPRSALGKLQRRVLARQLLAPQPNAAPADTQVNPTEHAIRQVWSAFLKIPAEDIGPNDDFFLLGGDSLLALQVVAAVGDERSIDMSAQVLFAAPTLREFATHVQTRPPRQHVASHLDASDSTPLSYAQKRFWFVNQLDPDGRVNNIARAFRLRGPLHVEALENALAAVLRRERALRTTFPMSDGAPVQQVQPPARVALPVVDARLTEVEALARREARRPFDLERDLPIRARLLRLAPCDAILLLTIHHIATDRWSTAILERELSTMYADFVDHVPANLPDLELQYTDFSDWQRAQVEAGAYASQLDYWKHHLEGAPPLLPLPTRGRRPALQTFRGALESFVLPRDLVEGITAVAREHQATAYMALLAAFAALLGRYSGESEVVIGSPTAGRTLPDTHDVVGCFINSIPLRVDVSGNPTFVELLHRVRQTVVEGLANQDLPFDRLVDALAPARDPRYAPIFQTMLALQNVPTGGLNLRSVEVEELPVDPGVARLDLTLVLRPHDGELRGSIEYNIDLFDADFIARLVGHYRNMLQNVLAHGPHTVLASSPILDDAEWTELVLDASHAPHESIYPRERSIVELFQEQAQLTPDALAACIGACELTYAELERRSNQLAHRIQTYAPGAFVGVCLPRSVDFVVAVLGILKAGAAYVPLDAAYPTERLAFMLRDTASRLLITDAASLARLSPEVSQSVDSIVLDGDLCPSLPDTSDCRPIAATDAAYVMYTSGSTGTPKGVVVPHRAVVRLVRSTNYLQLAQGDRVAFASDLSFDASTFELWGALLNGGTLVGIDKETLLDASALRRVLQAQGVTAMFLTTSVFNLCAREEPEAFGTLDTVLFGGEAADPAAVRAVLHSAAPPRRLLNVYGPTESTTFATWYQVCDVANDAEAVPIGGPISHTTTYVLDANQQPVPKGVVGELFLGGDGIAIGYLNQPELTATRFVPDPFAAIPDSRLYRTGDLVRHAADGQLVFVGRVDDQVKIRGIRVEPREIQTLLEQHPPVRQATVIARADAAGTRQLVAYVVSRQTPSELRHYLADKLPEALVPTIITLEALPMTPAGKLDREALPRISAEPPAADPLAPRTPNEHMLERIWARVLGVERVGIEDNFFDLGGHSILAAQLFADVERASGVRLPLSSLFPRATIKQQAELLEQLSDGSGGTSPIVVAVQPLGSMPPFVCVHAIDGDVLRFEPLARRLGVNQPFYALRARGLDADTEPLHDVPSMAALYIEELLRMGFREPFWLGGFSAGASIAFEMARQLEARGCQIALLALIDGHAPGRRARGQLRNLSADLQAYAGAAVHGGPSAFVRRQVRGLRGLTRYGVAKARRQSASADVLEAVAGMSERHSAVAYAQADALNQYAPGTYGGRILLFRARVRRVLSSHDGTLGWDRFALGGVDVVPVDGEHAELLREPYVTELSQRLAEAISSQRERLLS